MLDIPFECVIIVTTMKNHDNQPEPSVSELWRAWQPRQVILSKHQCAELGLSRKPDVYDWLYSIGIQPDRYIVRKASPSYIGFIEIRFKSESDMAFIKMSGIVPKTT
jgi:hypothetical protein